MRSKQKTPWQGVSKPTYAPLKDSITPEMVVVGGGLAGVLTTYLLAKSGKKVALLEKGEIGSGATMYTTAFLTESLDTDFTDLIKIFGKADAHEIVFSHKHAIDLVEQIMIQESIPCDFERCSNYIYINEEKEWERLQEEFDAAKDLGVEAEIYKDGVKLGFPNAGYIEMKNQAKFHPLKFLYGVAEKAVLYGAQIYEKTEVKDVNSDDRTVTLHANGHMITAPWGIVTTYEPFNKPMKLYFKKAFYTSYVFQIDVKGGLLQTGTFEDTANPYHYFRVEETRDGYCIILGGEDHRSDIHVDTEKSFNALKEYTNNLLAGKEYEIVRRWTGPILEPIDGIASIGPMDHPNLLYAMAFSGNGMTYSTIAAITFRDTIMGTEHAWHDIYEAKRLPTFKSLLKKGRDYGQELFHGAIKNTVRQKKEKKTP